MNSRRRSSNSLQKIPTLPQPVPIKESSFGSVVKQGFGWGLGNSLAHTLINTISRTTEVSEPIIENKIDSTQTMYKQCILEFDDKEACKHLIK